MADFEEITSAIARTARDAAYVALGLGVIAVQRAQVHRVDLLAELRKQQETYGERLKAAQDELTRLSRHTEDIDAAVESIFERLDSALAPIEDRLPERTRELVQQAHDQAKSVRRQIRSFIAPAA